jgi:hypothetical protein
MQLVHREMRLGQCHCCRHASEEAVAAVLHGGQSSSLPSITSPQPGFTLPASTCADIAHLQDRLQKTSRQARRNGTPFAPHP